MVKHEYHRSTSHEMYIFFMITWVFPTMGFIIGFPMNRMTNSLDDNLRIPQMVPGIHVGSVFSRDDGIGYGRVFSPGQLYIEMIILVDSPHPTMISTTHHKQGP